MLWDEVGDKVYLRVSPLRGVKRFGTYGRSCLQVGIARRIVRSSRCVPRSQLKKCHAEMAEIPLRDTVPLEAIQLDSDLKYEEKPVKILEFASRVMRNKVIKFCKVQWSHHTKDEATWEREEDLRKEHPHLLANPNLEGEIHLKGVGL